MRRAVTPTLLIVLSLLLFFVIPGFNFFITGGLFLLGLFFTVKNTISAMEPGDCSYPLSIPFLKPKA